MSLSMIDVLRLDVKQGLRRLRRNPGFTLTAVLSLALGIGANTTIFRVINAVGLRSLPVPRPQELVEVKIAGGTRGFGTSTNPGANATFPLWQEIGRHQRVLSGAFAWSANEVRFGKGADARLVRGLWVSPQAFRVLEIPARRGRLFGESDDHCDAGVAVVSHQFWLSYFAARDSAIGSRILVNDRPLVVIGVTPREFFGLETGKGFDVAVPLCARQSADPSFNRKDVWWLVVMGRLLPNLTPQAANAQIDAMSRGVFDDVAPDGYDGNAMDTWKRFRLTLAATPGGISRLRQEYESSLWFLLGVAGMVLLIACLNLANLQLAQAKERETEVAVRLALGMSQSRLACQLMTETLLLAIFGTVAGTLAGSVLSSALVALLSTSRELIQLDLGGDWRTLVFTAALAMFTCVLLGLAPLLRLSRTDVAGAMRAGSRSASQQSRRSMFQGVLTGSQLAISLVLLVASLSFVRSFRSLAMVDTGFVQQGLVFCFVDFSQLRVPPARTTAFQTELLETIRQAPGVEMATASTHVPLSGDSWTLGVRASGRDEEGSARFSWVSDNYFRTLGIPSIAGRTFTGGDSAASNRVLIVNETFARQFCPNPRKVGTRIRSIAEPGYPQTEYEIVGIVKDTKYDSLRENIPPAAYAPAVQNPDLRPWTSIIFRTSTSTAGSVAGVRRVLAAKVPGIRLEFEVLHTMAEDSIAREKLLAWLSGVFAVLATLLTCIGLYGVIAFVVSLRRSEMAVRMALGATPLQIAGMIVAHTARVAAIGTAAGVLLSLAGGRFARSLLFHLEPDDPWTFGGAVSVLLAVSFLASMYPALRAAFSRPAAALRGE